MAAKPAETPKEKPAEDAEQDLGAYATFRGSPGFVIEQAGGASWNRQYSFYVGTLPSSSNHLLTVEFTNGFLIIEGAGLAKLNDALARRMVSRLREAAIGKAHDVTITRILWEPRQQAAPGGQKKRATRDDGDPPAEKRSRRKAPAGGTTGGAAEIEGGRG